MVEQNQEQMIQLQMLGQEAQQLEQQLQMIEQHLKDMGEIVGGLGELENNESKEILANIGKGIYIPAEIKSKELIVEVGGKNLVKKSIPEAVKIINAEIEKLNSAKMQMMERVEGLQMEMQRVIGGK